MKIKLTVLTLLVAGLVLGLSGSAFAAAYGVIELQAQDNTTYTIDSPGVNVVGVPALKFKIDNTGTTDETITAVVLTNGAGTLDALAAGDFLVNLYLDADGNGVLSEGDSQLNTGANADVACGAGDGGKTTITLTSGLLINAGSDAYLIVTVTGDFDGPGPTVDLDVIEFVLVMTDALTDYSVTPTASATASLDPTDAANTPSIAVAAGAGTVTSGSHISGDLGVGDMPNKATDFQTLRFNLTADGTVSHVVEEIAITHAFMVAANTDFGEVKLYIDTAVGTKGVVDADDIELAITGDTDELDADADVYTLAMPLFIPASGVEDIIFTVTGAGTASDTEGMFSTFDVSASQVDGGAAIAGVDIAGGAQTIRALMATVTTKDFIGHPYNSSRPNGYLDAVKLEFTHNVTAGPPVATFIEDTTVSAASFTIKDQAGLAYTGLSFTNNYQGDGINDAKVYLKFTEKINVATASTKSTGSYVYTASTKVVSLDTQYALVSNSPGGAGVTDGAAPAPISIKTADTDGNGLVDQMSIQFSEALQGTGVVINTLSGITVAGHTATNIAVDCLLIDDPVWWGDNTKLVVGLDEDDEKDSSEKPAVSFAGAAGVIEDGSAATNDVIAWATTHLNVVDGALPTLVKVTTKDVNVDGHLDALALKFSEAVTVGSESDLLTDLDFAGGYEANYGFSTGVTGSGTNTLTVPVTPRAEYDSGVKPLITYGEAKSTLKDAADNKVAKITIIIPVGTVSAADEVVLSDGIRPVLGIAKTVDGYASGIPNGKIDAYKLIFSEEMNSTVAKYNNVKVAGNLITQNSAVIVADTVWVKFDEVESGYDTDSKPEVTYTIGLAVGDTTVTDANGVMLSTVASGTVVETDGAAPLIVKAKIKDIGYGKWISASRPKAANGQVDAIELTFSEAVDTTEVQYDEDANSDLIDEIEFTIKYTVGDTLCSFAADKKSVIIPIVEIPVAPNSSDTDLTSFGSELKYTVKGDAKLKDAAGMAVPNVIGNDTAPNVAESDGAPPVALSANTVDDNNDGFLDGVEVVFSEVPVIGEDDTTLAQAGVRLETLSNAIDLTAAELSTPTGVSIQFVGQSATNAEKWDTAKLPMVYIADGSGIKDSSGNEVVATPDSVATTDTAKPVIAKAVGQKESQTVLVTFSEEVTDEATNVLNVGDILYINIFDPDTDPTSITAVAVLGDDANWKLTTDNVLTSDHVTNDGVIGVAAKIQDKAATPNMAYVDTVTIADPSAPILVKSSTMDVNGDGRIDNIKLTFSENIKDINIRGYKAPKDTTVAWTSTTSDRWTIGEYFVLGVNFTCSDDAAAIATNEQRTALRLYPGKSVYNVDDVANDAIIYLAIREGDDADTGEKPKLSMVGGNLLTGTGVGDFSQNAAASFEEVTVSDGAAPRLISAEMTSTTVMSIIMSEEMEDPLPKASNVFVWNIGTEEVNNIGNVVDFTQPSSGSLMLEVQEIAAIPPGMVSTLAFITGTDHSVLNSDPSVASDGVIEDAHEVANADSADTYVDVTPPEGGEEVAEEEDALPDAYALSKNYPNPFNPTTTIDFAIPADGAGYVELVIYNINGQKVRTLVNETKEAGYYNVVWDGRNETGELVSSGIYLYRIASGNFVKIDKMTFMK